MEHKDWKSKFGIKIIDTESAWSDYYSVGDTTEMPTFNAKMNFNVIKEPYKIYHRIFGGIFTEEVWDKVLKNNLELFIEHIEKSYLCRFLFRSIRGKRFPWLKVKKFQGNNVDDVLSFIDLIKKYPITDEYISDKISKIKKGFKIVWIERVKWERNSVVDFETLIKKYKLYSRFGFGLTTNGT